MVGMQRIVSRLVKEGYETSGKVSWQDNGILAHGFGTRLASGAAKILTGYRLSSSDDVVLQAGQTHASQPGTEVAATRQRAGKSLHTVQASETQSESQAYHSTITVHSGKVLGSIADSPQRLSSRSRQDILNRHPLPALQARCFSSGSLAGGRRKEESSKSESSAPTGEWGSWISKRFSEAEQGAVGTGYLGSEPTDAEIQEELKRITRAAGDSGALGDDDAALASQLSANLMGEKGGEGEEDSDLSPLSGLEAESDSEPDDGLEALLDRAEADEDEWEAHEYGGGGPLISSRGGGNNRWSDVEFGGGAAEGLGLGEDSGNSGRRLSDAALSAIEIMDLDNEEKPYQLRADRLFYPGQTYETEELDISVPIAAESGRAPNRVRRVYNKKESLEKADFRNVRFLAQFLTSTSKILPRHKTQLSAKAQRKVGREIRASRVLGLLPFTTMGQPPFRFLRMDPDAAPAPPTQP